MRWLSKVTLILAIGLMLPGSLELAQDALHMALEGHTIHDEDEGHGNSTEHGCSGPYHFCSCCVSATFVSAPAMPMPACAGQVSPPVFSMMAEPVPSGHIDRMLRPPAA